MIVNRYINAILSVCGALVIGAMLASDTAHSHLKTSPDLPDQWRVYAGSVPITDVVSREFTVREEADETVAITDVVSREFTVREDADEAVAITDVVSREFTVREEADDAVAITDVVSREFTVLSRFDDCNHNGIRDECDLDCGPAGGYCDVEGCGQSNDIDENGVPDECHPDCDQDGILDSTEIENCDGDPDCSDCNSNDIPDGCDINPADPDGDGEVSGDCDGDGVPDECEIADCPPDDTSCDDCNINGVPDECDIDPDDPDGNGQVSTDLNMDGVPDECVRWDGENLDNLWSTALNWEADAVPGVGDPEALEGVVIATAGADVLLDVPAQVDSLFLGTTAALRVRDHDLTVVDPTDTLGGNMLAKGEISIADGRTITAEGEFTLDPGGAYLADPGGPGVTASTLAVGAVTIVDGAPTAGAMALDGSMVVVSQGNLVLEDDDEDKGDDTPPDLNVAGHAQAFVEGDFAILGEASLVYSSTLPMRLDGNLVNQATVFTYLWGTYDWLGGGLTLTGLDDALPLQTVEAAGKDWGPWPIGFVSNFAIGTLTVASGATVGMVDTFDNQRDDLNGCDEALYVQNLVVEDGGTLSPTGCTLYYEQLCGGTSCPGYIPGANVLEIQEPPFGDINQDGRVDPFDLAILLASWGPCPAPCTPGDQQPDPGCPADLTDDCEVDASDLGALLGNWTEN